MAWYSNFFTIRSLIRLPLWLALGVAAASFAAGEMLSRPARARLGAPPIELKADSVVLRCAKGLRVAGWFARRDGELGAILLLHGVRGNRADMLARAQWLAALGYSVLLIDLPAHGESEGNRISFGLREAEGVRAALAFLRQELPGQRIGVIGVSLGAAATVLAHVEPAPDALVLESMYPTIEEAVADRLEQRLGRPGRWLAPLLTMQLPLRLGISPAQLRPIDAMASLQAPVLVVAGSEDRHTTLAESERLFAAAGEPREIWVVQGAAHVDLHDFDPDGYETRVLGFLRRHLH
ncbi:MAG: alpha/beta fold hydrolase [Paucibacter sp.]|nr:alpha/beta fold hydrolase [Roseateles sp.]